MRHQRTLLATIGALLLLASTTGVAHHAISAKFDDKKPTTLNGIVTLVDWRNPHVHVFLNVKGAKLGQLVRLNQIHRNKSLRQGLRRGP